MKVLLTTAKRLGKAVAPAAAGAALSALAVGAISGYAASLPHRPGRGPVFALTASARTITVYPGGSARYPITIRRRSFRAVVALKLVATSRRGLTIRLTPKRTRGTRALISVSAARGLQVGRYVLRVRAAGAGRSRTMALLLLVVQPPTGGSGSGSGGTGSGSTGSGAGSGSAATGGSAGGGSGVAGAGQAPFTINGTPAATLEPSIAQPINLRIGNPNPTPLSISNLTVTVLAVQAPHASGTLPCTNTDFSVIPFSGPQPLVIPASTTATLAQLGVPSAHWPQVSLLDLPSNQDGCLGASLTLAYGAMGRTG